MPLYEFWCDRCDKIHEFFCRYEQRGEQRCPAHGSELVPLIGTARLIGAAPSKPIDMSKQLGRVFETNREYREYLATTPGVKEVSKADMRPKIERAKASLDRKSQAQGYRDNKHRCAEVNKRIRMEGNKA